MRMAVIALLMAGLAPSLATAGEMRVQVADEHGKPVSDAVVRVLPADPTTTPEPNAAQPPRTRIVDQRNEQFIPYVEVFRPGDQVVFRNSDTTRHHVYSFSPAKTFEMVVNPGQSTPPLALNRAGIVAVGCNIHDHMRTWLYVSPDTHILVTGATGVAQFHGLPAGRYRVVVWHPQLRPRQPEVASDVTLATQADTASQAIRLSLLPDPRKTMGGMSY